MWSTKVIAYSLPSQSYKVGTEQLTKLTKETEARKVKYFAYSQTPLEPDSHYKKTKFFHNCTLLPDFILICKMRTLPIWTYGDWIKDH